MRLREIPPERYAREVLPLTASLWAGRRTFEQYAAQTLEIARGKYGRRHYRTLGLYDGPHLVASCKRYERTVRDGSRRLRAIGFGAVYTLPEYRGRGYASVMLATELDAARRDGCALGFLFSDIRPQFYATLGFRELASRSLTLAADTLPSRRLALAPAGEEHWRAIRHCFELGERARSTGFARTPTVWDWVAMRARHGSEHSEGHPVNLVLRRSRGVCAYVFGVRVPERDTYVVDEFGFADGAAAETIPALLRAAAGDLRRVTGWLPPGGARELLPKGVTRKRKSSIFMIAPLLPEGSRLLEAISHPSAADFCWATDHM